MCAFIVLKSLILDYEHVLMDTCFSTYFFNRNFWWLFTLYIFFIFHRFEFQLSSEKDVKIIEWNIFIPFIVISFLGAFAFLLSPHSNDQMNFSVSILMASVVYLSFFADQLMSNGDNTSATGKLCSCFFA